MTRHETVEKFFGHWRVLAEIGNPELHVKAVVHRWRDRARMPDVKEL